MIKTFFPALVVLWLLTIPACKKSSADNTTAPYTKIEYTGAIFFLKQGHIYLPLLPLAIKSFLPRI